MKRCVAALIILAVVLASSFTITSVITAKADELITLAEKVYSQTESYEILEQEWLKQSNWFSLFINHNHLEPIGAKISELKYITDEDRLENCAQIISGLSEIKEHISLSLYTVF